MASAVSIRVAVEKDVPLILSFIRKLADYERLAHQVEASEGTLRTSLFGPSPSAEVLLAFVGDEPAGFALFFQNFSTFVGRPGLYLEDIYVSEGFRGRGIGRALFARLAQIACERNCRRFEWAVLDWNADAIRFYQGLGAVPMSDWRLFRLSGEALTRLGAKRRESEKP
jgi:GNAT superfamily N-acetyltransferase